MQKNTAAKYLVTTAMILFVGSCTIPAAYSQDSGASAPVGQNISQGISKQCVAFLVVNTPAGKTAFEGTRQRAASENYEIGPVVYYEPGTRDFESIACSLTPNNQVKLIWIVGFGNDIAPVKAALSRASYQGNYRYAVIIQGLPSKPQWTGA